MDPDRFGELLLRQTLLSTVAPEIGPDSPLKFAFHPRRLDCRYDDVYRLMSIISAICLEGSTRMTLRTMAMWVASASIAVTLAACGADETGSSEGSPSASSTPTATTAVTPAAEAAPTATTEQTSESEPAPISDIDAAVYTVVSALEDLGIEHTEPVRIQAAPGATASFDLMINGFDSGINVFPDEETLASWSELSDSLGGVHVSFDTSALSLNSREGIADSAEIAPKIAEAIDGTARGV